jgi:hypothetical protein
MTQNSKVYMWGQCRGKMSSLIWKECSVCWENNIKMDNEEIGCEDINWIPMA